MRGGGDSERRWEKCREMAGGGGRCGIMEVGRERRKEAMWVKEESEERSV